MVYYTLYLVDQNIIGADKIWSFGTKLLGLNFALEHLIDHPFGIGPTNLNVMALDLDLNLSSGYIELLVFFGWMAFPLFTPLVPIANALSNNTDKSLFSIRVGVLCVVLLSFVHGPTFNLFNTMMLSYVFLYRERSGANRCYGYQ